MREGELDIQESYTPVHSLLLSSIFSNGGSGQKRFCSHYVGAALGIATGRLSLAGHSQNVVASYITQRKRQASWIICGWKRSLWEESCSHLSQFVEHPKGVAKKYKVYAFVSFRNDCLLSRLTPFDKKQKKKKLAKGNTGTRVDHVKSSSFTRFLSAVGYVAIVMLAKNKYLQKWWAAWSLGKYCQLWFTISSCQANNCTGGLSGVVVLARNNAKWRNVTSVDCLRNFGSFPAWAIPSVISSFRWSDVTVSRLLMRIPYLLIDSWPLHI